MKTRIGKTNLVNTCTSPDGMRPLSLRPTKWPGSSRAWTTRCPRRYESG